MGGTMGNTQENGSWDWRIYQSSYEAFRYTTVGSFTSPSSKLETSITTDKKLGFSTTSHVIWLSFRPNIKQLRTHEGSQNPKTYLRIQNLKCTSASPSLLPSLCFGFQHMTVPIRYMYGE